MLRRKIPDRADAALDQQVAHMLRVLCRDGDDANLHLVAAADLVQTGHVHAHVPSERDLPPQQGADWHHHRPGRGRAACVRPADRVRHPRDLEFCAEASGRSAGHSGAQREYGCVAGAAVQAPVVQDQKRGVTARAWKKVLAIFRPLRYNIPVMPV